MDRYLYQILIVFFSVVFFRCIIYLEKLIKIKKYFKRYLDYCQNPTFEFNQYRSQILQLFKDVDIKDSAVHKLKPVGYGQIQNISMSALDNITLLDHDVVAHMRSRFNEAIGVFRHRMLQSFNPLFWLEMIFKLPQYLLQFLGVLPDKLIVKIALLIYWLGCFLLGLEKFNIINIMKLR